MPERNLSGNQSGQKKAMAKPSALAARNDSIHQDTANIYGQKLKRSTIRNAPNLLFCHLYRSLKLKPCLTFLVCFYSKTAPFCERLLKDLLFAAFSGWNIFDEIRMVLEAPVTRVSRQLHWSAVGLHKLCCGVGSLTSKDNQVKQGVCTFEQAGNKFSRSIPGALLDPLSTY